MDTHLNACFSTQQTHDVCTLCVWTMSNEWLSQARLNKKSRGVHVFPFLLLVPLKPWQRRRKGHCRVCLSRMDPLWPRLTISLTATQMNFLTTTTQWDGEAGGKGEAVQKESACTRSRPSHSWLRERSRQPPPNSIPSRVYTHAASHL